MRVMFPGESDSAEQRDTFEGVLDADRQSGQRCLSRDKSVLILAVLFGPSRVHAAAQAISERTSIMAALC